MIEQNQIGKLIFLPFTDPYFNNIWKLGEKWIQQKNQKDLNQIEKFKLMDKKDFDPIYYCYKCQRLEDGTHRSWAMREKGYNGYETFIGKTCWKKIYNLHTIIGKLINKKNLKTRDVDWVNACRSKKWITLKNIDFSGKTYLDIGSQSGYSAFMGWNCGAISIIGIEKRKEIFDISEETKNILAANEITFYNNDWLQFRDNVEKFDIISCMGLMHYFDINIFDFILQDLFNKCLNILILELRICDNINAKHIVIDRQTLITTNHLKEMLINNKFKILSITDITNKNSGIPGKRELWIMEKI